LNLKNKESVNKCLQKKIKENGRKGLLKSDLIEVMVTQSMIFCENP